MAKVIIIGTSHISPESVEDTRKIIEKEKPDCVAVELDPERYYALKMNMRGASPKMGITGLFLHYLQDKLSKKTGIIPGTEMMSAVKAGQDIGAKVVLIDKSIREIMFEIRKIKFTKKIKFFWKLLFGMFHKDVKKIDLRKVPEDKLINEALRYMKKEMPEFYKVLITDRNKYMHLWIKKLMINFDKIVVVVGAGHKKGLEKMLK